MTVRNAFNFAYKTNAPEKVISQLSGKGVEPLPEYPEEMIKELGLENCADTIVGNVFLRGVSGGEKKRVTIGEMLFRRQPILLADEITTGLDSATAFEICSAICNAADENKFMTPIISLLQPAPEILNIFDKVIIIAQGQILYHGPIDDSKNYFESLGFTCPDDKDLAEFLVEVCIFTISFVNQ